MSNIKINLNGLEIMVFFWNSIVSKEKLNEAFINDICTMKEYQNIYNNEFTFESLRTVLSAITNKEPYKGNKKEMKFYSNNLRILEYIDDVNPIIDKIKKLNLDSLISKSEKDLEIIILPATTNSIVKFNNSLVVDFFALRLIEDELLIGEEKLIDLIQKTV